MTKTLAVQLGRHGITVNCIHLGTTRTERTPSLFAARAAQLSGRNRGRGPVLAQDQLAKACRRRNRSPSGCSGACSLQGPPSQILGPAPEL